MLTNAGHVNVNSTILKSNNEVQKIKELSALEKRFGWRHSTKINDFVLHVSVERVQHILPGAKTGEAQSGPL